MMIKLPQHPSIALPLRLIPHRLLARRPLFPAPAAAVRRLEAVRYVAAFLPLPVVVCGTGRGGGGGGFFCGGGGGAVVGVVVGVLMVGSGEGEDAHFLVFFLGW